VPFQNFTVTQVTNSGTARTAAVSPDAKYVISVIDTNGKGSLWLRNVATGSDTQVLAPEPLTIRRPAFSPDGNYIFFRKATDASQNTFNIYRMPVLGGTPQLLVRDVDNGPGLSVDGKRMAYLRGNDPEPGKYRLLSANLDGSDEQVLQVAPLPIPDNLDWSPDSSRIAFISYAQNDAQGQLSLYDVASKKATAFTTFSDKFFSDLAWAPDGRGLLVNYGQLGGSHLQLGFISYPEGRFQSLTNDTRGYQKVSLSADGKSIVAIQSQTTDLLSVQAASGKGSATEISGVPNQALIQSVGWDSQGNLMVTAAKSVLHFSTDGKQQTTLLKDLSERIFSSSICPHGGPILLSTFGRNGKNTLSIWAVNQDGTHPRQLTTGKDDELPVCSPDGKSFYYSDNVSYRVMKAPIEGGTPEMVKASAVASGFMMGALNFSPDGKWLPMIEAVTDPATQAVKHRILLIDATANRDAPLKYFDVRSDVYNTVASTPDGKALAYTVVDNGVGNIWEQPLDGSKGHFLTSFTSDQISAFQFSPDGKTLAVARARVVSDVVLLHDSLTSR
jgi:Tol biopolymer transport system component